MTGTATTIDTPGRLSLARNLLRGIHSVTGAVVLVACIDPRLNHHLHNLGNDIEELLGKQPYVIRRAGASRQLADPVARARLLEDERVGLMQAELILLQDHGSCADYGARYDFGDGPLRGYNEYVAHLQNLRSGGRALHVDLGSHPYVLTSYAHMSGQQVSTVDHHASFPPA